MALAVSGMRTVVLFMVDKTALMGINTLPGINRRREERGKEQQPENSVNRPAVYILLVVRQIDLLMQLKIQEMVETEADLEYLTPVMLAVPA